MLFALAVVLLASAGAPALERSLTINQGSTFARYQIYDLQLRRHNGQWEVSLLAKSGALIVRLALFSASSGDALQLHRNLAAIFVSNVGLAVQATPSGRDEKNSSGYQYTMADRDILYIDAR
jgi:hypothetical protein